MFIWLSILIPVLTSIVLYVWFKHHTTWWEFLIPFAVSIILIAGCKALVEQSQVTDTEYWGGWVENSIYLEDWDEYVHKTCSSTDSDGNTTYYDCSYVDYHPPQWYIVDSNHIKVGINESKYQEIKTKLGNEVFVDLNRSYHSNDGDKYQCGFNYKTDDPSKLVPVTTIHRYENRVQASNSVYKFREVTKEDLEQRKLFEYPKIQDNIYVPSILGANYPEARQILDRFNARYGRQKEIRVFLLIFRDQPEEAGILQENYWKGGNKNEFIICLGLSKTNDFQWQHTFSWSTNEECVINSRNWLNENLTSKTIYPEDLENFAIFLTNNLKSTFKRKEFSEFSYLSVEPKMWQVIMTYIVVLLINIGCSAYIILNEFGDRTLARKTTMIGSRC